MKSLLKAIGLCVGLLRNREEKDGGQGMVHGYNPRVRRPISIYSSCFSQIRRLEEG